ncbi:MAG TPA: D-alanyl-lipoteichoic acid biosynthesis protein DltD [Candidatus Udaeobacter sp.]
MRSAIRLERRALPWTAPEVFQLKNQGLAFQRAAARATKVLPLYGSSELVLPIPQRASSFFCAAPTGFQVSPVGNTGMALLVIVQKVAALGSDLHGKKLAVSLSPDWFLTPSRRWRAYEGNFSVMTATEMTFDTTLEFELKRKIALHMLQYPSSLEKSPLLEFALSRLASGRWFDRIVLCALWPLGKMQTAIMQLQDHYAALDHIRHQSKPATSHSEIPDWPKLIARASALKTADRSKIAKASYLNKQLSAGSRDAAFRSRMNAAPGWADLELLLRTLASVHARPLLLSMPIDGQFYDEAGVSRSAREAYYKKLRLLAQRYNFPLVEFEEHDDDPAFLLNHSDHLTGKGWVFYDRALDDFFHGRVARN